MLDVNCESELYVRASFSECKMFGFIKENWRSFPEVQDSRNSGVNILRTKLYFLTPFIFKAVVNTGTRKACMSSARKGGARVLF